MAVRSRAGERSLAAPGGDAHPERVPVAGNESADRAISDDPERLPVELDADRRLPGTRTQRDGILDDAARGGENQRERQLGGGVRRSAAVADDDSSLGTRSHVDVRHAATRLADEAQPRQKLEEGRIDRRPFANEHERLGIADLRGSFGHGPRAFGMDNDVVPRNGGEAP